MEKRLYYETFIVTIFGIIAMTLAILAVLHARAEVRDDLRRQDVTNMKRALETYNNIRSSYVPAPSNLTGDTVCTTSLDINSWFFGPTSPLLTQQIMDAMPHDVRETKGFEYRYCITDRQRGTQGYFLEAQMETAQHDIVGFDEDEQRKFSYRILHDGDRALYRVCGGTEKQCDLPSSEGI